MPSTIRDQPSPRLQMEAEYSGPLSKVQMQVIALLIEGGRTMEQLAEEVGWDRQTIWRWRKKPEFQAEYLKQLRAVEQQALDYGISRRVERIAALNDAWLKLKEDMARKKTPRTDHVYALIALQAEARKEIEGDVHRIEGRMEITQAIRVIRFVEQEPHPSLSEGDEVVDAEFAEIPSLPEPEPGSDAEFTRALQLAGARIKRGVAMPEELAAIRAAIRERGINPEEVLSDEQYRVLYGRGKQDDPWG